jgi:hypothetical protein
LKDKPFVKDTLYSNKHKAKQETAKLNASLIPSSIQSAKAKTVIGNTNPPGKVLNKIENEYVSSKKNLQFIYSKEKHAFHSSLLKSIDATDRSGLIIQTEDTVESHRDSINKENLIGSKVESTRPKTYHISATFKSPAGTPRVANETLKSSTLANTSKILNARKSHDISYLSKHKKKKSNELGIQVSASNPIKNRSSDIKGNQD